jgi:hypothetical protein
MATRRLPARELVAQYLARIAFYEDLSNAARTNQHAGRWTNRIDWPVTVPPASFGPVHDTPSPWKDAVHTAADHGRRPDVCRPFPAGFDATPTPMAWAPPVPRAASRGLSRSRTPSGKATRHPPAAIRRPVIAGGHPRDLSSTFHRRWHLTRTGVMLG